MLFETHEDLRREAEIAKRVAAAWQVDAKKLPKKYALDYALMRGKQLMAFAEIKDRRKYSMAKLNELGGYMISLHKVERGKSLCKEARVSFFVIVKCSDATYYVNMEEIKNPRVGFFDGNKIPRRVEDKEPVIYIDAYWFSTLRGGACQPP